MTKSLILLQALASTPVDLARVIRPIDEISADRIYEPGVWSAREVVSHLIQMEEAYLAGFISIITTDSPPLHIPHFDINRHRNIPLNELSHKFGLARQNTLALLESLKPGQWQRVALHEVKGRIILRFVVQDLVTHDIEHTNQLLDIIQLWRAYDRKTAKSTD